MKERIKKILKNKKILLSILIGISFMVSVSYAMYNIVLQGQRNHSITTSKLSFTYKEPLEALDLLAHDALTDEEGKSQNNYYEFTIKAESDAAEVIDYVVYLQKEESEKSFSSSDIKVYLTSVSNDVETQVLEPTLVSELLPFNETENTSALYGSNFTFTDTDLVKKETTYRLRIWLREGFDIKSLAITTTTNGEQNIKLDSYEYKFKVNVATGKIPENVDSEIVIDNLSSDNNNPTVITSNSYNVYANVSDANGVKSVTINGIEAILDENSRWYAQISLAVDTTTEVVIVATDNFGKTTTIKRYLHYNSSDPELVVNTPASTSGSDPTIVDSDVYIVSGTVSDASGVRSVTVDGASATLNSDGTFSKSINLEVDAIKEIIIVATDNYGRTTTEKRYVMFEEPIIYLFKEGEGFVAGEVVSYTVYESPISTGYAIATVGMANHIILDFNSATYQTGRRSTGPLVIIGLKDGSKIDFSKYNYLYFEFENKGFKTSSSYTRAAYGYTTLNSEESVYCDGATTYGFENSFFDLTATRTTRSIDISSVTGEYFVALAQSSAHNSVSDGNGIYIYNIWLE